ncbi:MAG: transcriptional repressor LexA [Planctomycetota bacterium]
MNLTQRQHQIVKYIWKYRKSKGLAPTLAEIAGHLGISKVTVHEHISQLEGKGALEKEPFLSRSTRLTRRMLRELEKTAEEASRYVGIEAPDPEELEVVRRDKPSTLLPLLGKIAAGSPLEAVEESEPVDLVDLCQLDRANYVLQVKGDSMIEDGIFDGDFVLVEQRNDARNGETVVAVLPNNEATLKRFFRQKGRFKLEPANATLEPIYTDKVEIRGVVVGVVRGC